MLRIGVTILLIVAWHFPTTFFVPQDAPSDRGWLIWPFGKASTPVLDGLQGAIAPSSLSAMSSPTLAMALAGIASLAFVVAIASLGASSFHPSGGARQHSWARSVRSCCS